MPETEYPAPETAAELTTTEAVPEEVRVNVWVEVLPTTTLPRLAVAGLTVRWGAVAAVPVPVRVTAAAPVESLLDTELLPVTAPAAAGLN